MMDIEHAGRGKHLILVMVNLDNIAHLFGNKYTVFLVLTQLEVA